MGVRTGPRKEGVVRSSQNQRGPRLGLTDQIWFRFLIDTLDPVQYNEETRI